MNSFGEDSPQRLRLGSALRRLRLRADLTGEQLAQQAGMSQSKVSRIELGQSAAAVADVERWAQATGASDDERAELLELAEAAVTETIAWRTVGDRGLGGLQRDVQVMEISAATIRYFHPVLVPGLLQTAEYYRRLGKATFPEGRPDLAAAMAARMERQAMLYDETKRLEFVTTEVALRWRFGPPPTMLAQLDRILTVATLTSVEIGIIPQTAELAPSYMHGFTIFDDRGDEDPIVEVETLTTRLTITDPRDVETYRQHFARLREAAVSGDDALALLRAIMADLRSPST